MVPNGWEKHPIGNICRSIVPGRNKPKVFNGDIPWVTTPEIDGKYIPSSKQVNYISNHVAKECGAKLVPEGAVVIAAVGDLGLTAIASEKLFLNQQLHAFVCPESVHNEYIAYFLSSQKPYMYTVASKTTIPYMNKSNCESIPILLPPLPEQQKIAKILSTWDKAIATTDKLIDASQQQKKALMQQLLTGKKRLVNPDTGKVFEGDWEEVRVANFGKVVTGNTPPKGDDSNYGSDISWATAEDFKGKYVGNTKVKLTKSGVSKARLVPKGSVLVTCIASIGKNAIADEDLTTNQQINAVIVNSKHCNEFFYYQIEFNKHKLLAWAGTTAVPILNKSSFEKILLLAPLKHEQQKIASVLTAADKEIELLETKLAHLKNEKKALMQQLLTGKRRVKVEAMEMA
ncbi:restriction endonuclease subunit S [Providencia rettgeri]|uniref:restriction endonuclease subunit S n=1 Tax=Providencia rettgeri TaxID=587 RepID=UPI0018C76309|nr:restriction endonuclease subunit S [Providencia rettgeri]MBG5898897.1 restriction endonuclease subunit S [Providencia rettgeri]